MYNLDELTVEYRSSMKRYVGELVFLKNCDSNNLYVFLRSWNNGEAVINSINFDEIREIFSDKLFEITQERTVLLDFWANYNENGELYDIKELIVYDRYIPALA